MLTVTPAIGGIIKRVRSLSAVKTMNEHFKKLQLYDEN
jgi:hypothetical protein